MCHSYITEFHVALNASFTTECDSVVFATEYYSLSVHCKFDN